MRAKLAQVASPVIPELGVAHEGDDEAIGIFGILQQKISSRQVDR